MALNLITNQVNKFKKIANSQQQPATQELAVNLKSFFDGTRKTIQKNFRFDVEFNYLGYSMRYFEGYPQIQPWHVKKVSFPIANRFAPNVIKIGPFPYCYPTLNSDGYDFDVTFEEDEDGTVINFIQFLQQLIFFAKDGEDNAGNYRSQKYNRLSSIIINIYDDVGDIVRKVIFNNCFFLNASALDLDYDGNGAVQYTVTFHSDLMEQE